MFSYQLLKQANIIRKQNKFKKTNKKAQEFLVRKRKYKISGMFTTEAKN